nr:glutathione S-transferase T3-like [Lolium perenne]
MDCPQEPPTAGDASPPATVVDVAVGDAPNAGAVSAMISATIPSKRKRIPKQFFEAPAAAAAAAPAAASPAIAPPTGKKGGRLKTKAAGPRGVAPAKVRTKAISRIGLAPPPPSKATPSPPSVPSDAPPAPPLSTMDVDKVFDVESTTTYMDMLNGSAVNLDAGIDAFDAECNVEDIDEEEEDEGDEEEVVEVDPAAAGSSSTPKPRTANYSEIEDAILVRACSKVGMDACTGVDQGGKRYWQRIEDLYHQLKPRTKSMADRSYRSLEGRWNIIKPACSRWSAAMDQVADNPPSGCVPEDYPKYAQARYKDMAGSKNKEFQFQHCFSILQHLPKWKLRDNEPKCKKEALLTMDDEAEDMSGRNTGKPEGNKKAKERVKVELEAASFREKLDQLMKSKEALTMKTLETKLIITDKKSVVKLAKVQARKELDMKMIAAKEAKAMKELLAEEREIMMMRTDGMDEDQLA